MKGGTGTTLHASCERCGKGAEVCMYCSGTSREDWETICDCGLFDFGAHLIACNVVTGPPEPKPGHMDRPYGL